MQEGRGDRGRYRPRHSAPARGSLPPRPVWLTLGGLCALVLGIVGVQAIPAPSASRNPSINAGPNHPQSNARFTGSTPQTTSSAARTTAAADQVAALGFGPRELAAWVEAENAKPGTTDWQLTKPATSHQIEGYAGEVSVEMGEAVELYVSTIAAQYSIGAYRMGYYGGSRGRLVWSADSLAGFTQRPCKTAPRTRTVSCNWSDPLTVETAGWPQGDYLFKLTASTGWQSYVPLTIRDDQSTSTYLVNSSIATWEAYNLFGGRDLYTGPVNGGASGLGGRSQVVSFDRPYALGDGSGDYIGLELPMVSMMESLGLDVSYTTDVDVSERPQLLIHHLTFVSLGHDEYFTLAMRDGLTAARDNGVNLVFLGANAAYRHIRLEPSPLGPDRLEVDYKNPYADPLFGKVNADVTAWAWRDFPNNAPESELIGEMWQCNPVQADMVITDASAWVYQGAGLHEGSRIAGIVGPEYDHFDPYSPNPGDVTVVARTPVRCDGRGEEADMTYYSSSSGAGVWDTGTIDWVGSVLPYCAGCEDPDAVTRITVNVLATFGTGPAGVVHPSQANVLGSSTRGPPTTLNRGSLGD